MKKKVLLPLGFGCMLLLVAFIVLHYASDLFGAPALSEPAPQPAPDLFARKKLQILKRWGKIQRYLGLNPESFSARPFEDSPSAP